MTPRTSNPHSRARRFFGVVGKAVACALVLVSTLVASVAIHLDLPIVRRIAIAQVSAILASTFEGHITIEELGSVGTSGIRGLSVRLRDPRGRDVLSLHGVSVKLSVVGVARSAIAGKGPIGVDLSELTVDDVNANLDTDEKGNLDLLDALESRDKSPSDPHARGVRISIAHILVRHAWVHGHMQSAPAIDADLDALMGSVLVTPAETKVDVNQVALSARAMPSDANPHGVATFHLAMPAKSGGDLGLDGTFAGDAGGVPITAKVSMDGSRVDAIVDVPRTKAETLRALLPTAPIYDDVEAHAEVHGVRPDLAATAQIHVGSSLTDASAEITLLAATKVHLSVAMSALDIRSFSPTAPASTLGATTTLNLVVNSDSTITGDFQTSFDGGRLGTNDLPKASIQGTFAKTQEGPSAHVEATIAERGAPTTLVVALHSGSMGPILDVAARVRAPNLDAVARIGPIAKGSAQADITATVHLNDNTFVAKLDADLRDLEKSSVASLRHAHVEGHASGGFGNPLLDVAVRGETLSTQGVKLSHVDVHARGHVFTPQIDIELQPEDKTLPRIDVHADVQAGSGTLGVALLIDGLGAPLSLQAKKSGSTIDVGASGKDVDLGRIAQLLHRQAQLKSGHLALQVDLTAKPDSVLGHILVDVSHAGTSRIPDANAHVDLTFLKRRLLANVRADLGDIGHAYFTTTTLAIEGTPLDRNAWKKAAGDVQIDAKIDLDKVAALLPKDSLPVGELGGTLVLKGNVGRGSAEDHPSLALSIQTQGLVVAEKSPPAPPPIPGTLVVAPPQWRTTGVDVDLDAKLDAGTGHVDFDAKILDKDGTIASLALDSTLPYRDLVAHPDETIERLETLPFQAKFAIPRRRLNRFPPAAKTKGLHGDVELSADIEGPLRGPKITLALHAKDLKSAQSPLAIPVSADVALQYEGQEGKVTLDVATDEEKVMNGDITLHGSAADFLDHPISAATPWDASVHVHAANFPLESLAMLTDRNVRGRVSGDVSLDNLHKDARAKAALTLADMQIGQALYGRGAVNGSFDGSEGALTARLDQKDGFAEMKGAMGLKWGGELAPSLDRAKAVSASLRAHGFRAAAILPFVAETFSELDGNIDADARVVTGPGGADPKFEGTVVLRDGLFQLPSLGEEFHAVAAKLSLRAGGQASLDNVVAYGTTGKLTASAQANLQGLTFHDAKASLDIPHKQPLPLNVQGVEIGEAYGHVDVQAKAVTGGIDLTVNVPHWHTALPESTKHTVQDLDRAKFIHVGVHRGQDEQLVLLPLDAADLAPEKLRDKGAAKITVRVVLGDDIEIKRGSTLKVTLTGSPLIEVTDKARVSGQIRLKTGTIEVEGKRFQIESGTVSFVGKDSTNPEIVATAGWTAPEGTRIFADFAGPLRTGKVILRSEPSRPNSEILALIIFGTADGANATAPPDQKTDPTTQAVGVGGGVATQGLNKAISDLTGVDNAQLRVDTTNSANPRPELEIQVAKDISIGIATVLGVPPPDQPDQVFGQADWRFHRNWSLETMFGNLGTTMFDAVWDYRY